MHINLLYCFQRKLENCKQCDTPLETPVQLPCGHKICDSCVVQLNYADKRKCPDCKKTWEESDNLSNVEQQ